MIDADFQSRIVAQAQEWIASLRSLQAERESLANQQATILQRLEQIDEQVVETRRYLQAATTMAPEVGNLYSDVDVADAESDVKLTDAIIRVLTPYQGAAISRDKIRRRLPNAGYSADRINANPDYLYIALKRLEDRRILRREGDNFALIIK